MKLAAALAKVRALTPPVTVVTGAEAAAGNRLGMGRTQAPQGIDGFGYPVTGVTVENVASSKFPLCGPPGATQRGSHPVSPVTAVTTVTVQQPRGFERLPDLGTPAVTAVTWADLMPGVPAYGGDDHRGAARRSAPVGKAAGGWSDAAAVHLPVLAAPQSPSRDAGGGSPRAAPGRSRGPRRPRAPLVAARAGDAGCRCPSRPDTERAICSAWRATHVQRTARASRVRPVTAAVLLREAAQAGVGVRLSDGS